MGISKGGAHLLVEEFKSRPANDGKILQLGRQHLFIDESTLRQVAIEHSFDLTEDFPRENVTTPILGNEFLDDGSFFSHLGFSSVESIDFSGDESPTYVHDFNEDVPDELHGRFDAVYDGGTIEHIFDVRQSFKNIYDLLDVGGRAIHLAPSSNHVDHGFYMFSPTLFYDYYRANGYKIHACYLVVYSRNHNDTPWKIYDYTPGCLDKLSFGGFDQGDMLALFVSSEKTPISTWEKIPQQGMYSRRWSDYDENSDPETSDTNESNPEQAGP